MEGKIIPKNIKHVAQIVYKENTFVITSYFSYPAARSNWEQKEAISVSFPFPWDQPGVGFLGRTPPSSGQRQVVSTDLGQLGTQAGHKQLSSPSLLSPSSSTTGWMEKSSALPHLGAIRSGLAVLPGSGALGKHYQLIKAGCSRKPTRKGRLRVTRNQDLIKHSPGQPKGTSCTHR